MPPNIGKVGLKKDIDVGILNVVKFVTGHPLNKHREVRALFEFAKWQIGSRLVPGAVVFDWINGSRFLVRRGETGLTGNVYAGLHEFADMAFLLHFLRKEDVFIDVGANVGSYTILASAAVGCNAYAFEPIPATFQRLTANLRLNNLDDRVNALNVGIGSSVCEMAFTVGLDTVNHVVSIGEDSTNSVLVKVAPLDQVLIGESPTMIKIDVEGYETPALEGATHTLRSPSLKVVIMELNGSGSRYGYDEAKILELMLDLGFESFSYDPFRRILTNLKGKNLSSGNTLFLRDHQFVCDRLDSAPKIVIHDWSL